MSKTTIYILIAVGIVLAIVLLRVLKMRQDAKSEPVAAGDTKETLIEEFMSKSGPFDTRDHEIKTELKDLGHCVGYGGTGIMAARWNCKDGQPTPWLPKPSCGCSS